jgi:hypothetical protein
MQRFSFFFLDGRRHAGPVLGGEHLVPLIGSGVLVFDVDLEEGLDVLGGRLKVLSLQRLPNAVDVVGAVDNGIDAKEGRVDAGLHKVDLVDLVADLVGQIAGGRHVAHHVLVVHGHDVEDLGGLLEVDELLVEVEAL